MRRIAVMVTLLLIAGPAAACTFCAGGLAGRQTLREHFRESPLVLYGTLKNARPDPDGLKGSTELHVASVVKGESSAKVTTIPRYIPVHGDTPAGYLVFFAAATDPTHGTAATEAVAEYVRGFAKIDDKPTTRLGYAFKHLDSRDPAVAADAFLEFAKAADADILAAKATLDPAKVKTLLLDPATPDERVGVYALMLGLSGSPADAAVIRELLAMSPRPDRVGGNLGGLLAGLTLLDPAVGWATLDAILGDAKATFPDRLAAVGTVRFFQATRGVESRPQVLRCYHTLIAQGDLADLAIEDLRRWGWFDLTGEVLAAFGEPGKQPPIARRAIVRYALTSPQPEAKRFVERVRATEPKLVQGVEEALKLAEK